MGSNNQYTDSKTRAVCRATDHRCTSRRYVWPELGTTASWMCRGIDYYTMGRRLSRDIRGAITDERRSRYRECMEALLGDIPEIVSGCEFQVIRGLYDGLHPGPEIEFMELINGDK